MTRNEIVILDAALKEFPQYGVFEIFSKLAKSDTSSLKDFDIGEVSGLEQSNIHIYLTENGFVVPRNDIIVNATTVELTDLGRRLKSLGSLERYNDDILVKAKEAKFQSLVLKNSYKVNVIIAVGTSIAALYYFIEILKTIGIICTSH